MFRLSPLYHPLALCTRNTTKRCTEQPAIRPLFTLPDLSKLSPFSGPNDSSGDPQTYHERKILPYRPSQTYKIVSDVASYPRFLPFCTGTKILSRATPGDLNALGTAGAVRMEAEMTVGFMTFEESYISKVTCTPYESVEAVAASSTPLFKTLTTTWRFQPASTRSPHPSRGPPLDAASSDATKDPDEGPTLVTLDLAFSFSNPVHAAVSAAFFGQVSKMMVTAFEERCLDLYGPGKR